MRTQGVQEERDDAKEKVAALLDELLRKPGSSSEPHRRRTVFVICKACIQILKECTFKLIDIYPV